MTRPYPPFLFAEFDLDIGVSGRSGEGLDVADIRYSCDIHDQSFKAKPEAGVARASVFPKLRVPPVVLFIEAAALVGRFEIVETLLALAASDELAHAGDEHIRGGDGLAVVVEAVSYTHLTLPSCRRR